MPVSGEDLTKIAALTGLKIEALNHFALGLGRLYFAPGDVLVAQGSVPQSAYYIEEGEIDIVVRQPGGDQTKIAHLGAGDLVGEQGLVYAMPRSASVIAQTPGKAIVIDSRFFRSALLLWNETAITLLRYILSTVCDRFVATCEQIAKSNSSAQA